jgi:menaquinone-9 beta-reductase
MHDVVIIGGGLAGLVAAIDLADGGFDVVLLEQKRYPFQRVCGEYISNEVLPVFARLGIELAHLGLPQIRRVWVTSVDGKRELRAPLPLGGFGVSRLALEEVLVRQARERGARILERTAATGIQRHAAHFVLTSDARQFSSRYVLGAFGKRSALDRRLERRFMDLPTPWMAVKYHVEAEVAADEIALHNFENGYCGVAPIEGGRVNLCYLTHRKNLRAGSIAGMERHVLAANPHLEGLFKSARFLHDKPLAISHVSFAAKQPVEHGVLMIGDAAGLITPLCGNGMAMAIHGAMLATGLLRACLGGEIDQARMETLYARAWREAFARRLRVGRTLQGAFGRPRFSSAILQVLGASPALTQAIIARTHGRPLEGAIGRPSALR